MVKKKKKIGNLSNWSCSVHFGPSGLVWFVLVQFGPFNLLGSLRSNLFHFSLFWSFLVHFSRFGPFSPICPIQSIQSYLVHVVYFGPFNLILSILVNFAPFGLIWCIYLRIEKDKFLLRVLSIIWVISIVIIDKFWLL